MLLEGPQEYGRVKCSLENKTCVDELGTGRKEQTGKEHSWGTGSEPHKLNKPGCRQSWEYKHYRALPDNLSLTRVPAPPEVTNGAKQSGVL